MTRKITNYYWVFIVLLQVGIIIKKLMFNGIHIQNSMTLVDAFFSILWNMVALLGALIFIYNRFYKNRVLLSWEIPLSAFLALDGVSNSIAQFIRLDSYLVLYTSLIVAPVLLFMTYYIWKAEQK